MITWIEASAGTGKTYTLVKTVVDLVESGMPVERILLVTFTEKATAELKGRIRDGLREAAKKRGGEVWARALEELPSLTVTTIHGFCRLLLTQFPLESGVSFEPELVDQGRQWRRLLRAEVRPRLAELDPALLAWAGVEDEEALLGLAQAALNRDLFSLPLLHPDTAEQALFHRVRGELERREGPLWEAIDAAPQGLPEDSAAAFGADTIARSLHASWHKGPYKAVRGLAAARSFRDLMPLLDAKTLDQLRKWDEGGNVWKKGAGPDTPRLQEVCAFAAAFVEAAEGLLSALPAGVALDSFLEGAARHALLDALCRPVREHRSARELTFHDLIDRVRDLARGGALADAAADRWSAVLIDEFQDTDPAQWEIFRELFAGERHRLTLVGDPKQSIYRFRGADLDVYRAVGAQLDAAGADMRRLDENFRSTAAMIEAVNTLFAPGRAAWDHPDDFTPSRKGDKRIAELVRREGGSWVTLPPLAVYREGANDWHGHLVATVAALIDGSHVLRGEEDKPVDPGDILVLVRQKREAWQLYRLLTDRGIPAAVGGSGGLLKSREAAEVLLFLKALENPRSLSAAQALAWTRLFTGADLDRLVPALEEAQGDRARGAFLRAFRRVAAALEPSTRDGGGLERLLKTPGGARVVTNAEHVLEFVQERHHRGDTVPGRTALSLETWMASNLQEDEVDLRRDGEIPTLRLMTVHAAKGLESPIVLHGKPSKPKASSDPWLIAGGVDFLKTEDSRAADLRAAAAEDLRVRYVALTRARTHQVFLDDSWPGALEVPEAPPGVRWSGTRPALPSLRDSLVGLERRHPWVESHSGLWKRASRDQGTEWDRPVARREAERDAEPDEADTLPAGPVFGDLVHDILEKADFRGWAAGSRFQAEAETLVGEASLRARAAFQGRDLSKPLFSWLGRTLNHSFALGGAELVFSSLTPEDTRRELEFHLPLAGVEAGTFLWGGKSFTVHPGYLTGRIDLLFRWQGKLYLADWKTNRLAPGERPEGVMREAGYDLQAQWYWEALTRLARLQGEALTPGGVLYVFLRGGSGAPEGVFLPPEILDANLTLDSLFREARRA